MTRCALFCQSYSICLWMLCLSSGGDEARILCINSTLLTKMWFLWHHYVSEPTAKFSNVPIIKSRISVIQTSRIPNSIGHFDYLSILPVGPIVFGNSGINLHVSLTASDNKCVLYQPIWLSSSAQWNPPIPSLAVNSNSNFQFSFCFFTLCNLVLVYTDTSKIFFTEIQPYPLELINLFSRFFTLKLQSFVQYFSLVRVRWLYPCETTMWNFSVFCCNIILL
jgi:hypothetical protein